MWPYPHPIRLRGFWAVEPAGDAARVRYCRRFGAPTSLDEHEQVWLVCEGAIGRGAVVLNGEYVGEIDPDSPMWQWDVTRRIKSRNELCLELERNADSAQENAPARTVRLEIRTSLVRP
jgi:hypothetical protein